MPRMPYRRTIQYDAGLSRVAGARAQLKAVRGLGDRSRRYFENKKSKAMKLKMKKKVVKETGSHSHRDDFFRGKPIPVEDMDVEDLVYALDVWDHMFPSPKYYAEVSGGLHGRMPHPFRRVCDQILDFVTLRSNTACRIIAEHGGHVDLTRFGDCLLYTSDAPTIA